MPGARLGVTLRVLDGDAIALGPGKADLLEAIAANGSISAAARRMGLSYRRAWLLVDTMNSAFAAPLVAAAKGGEGGGGATLTPLGIEVRGRYRAMVAAATAAAAPEAKALLTLLRPAATPAPMTSADDMESDA